MYGIIVAISNMFRLFSNGKTVKICCLHLVKHKTNKKWEMVQLYIFFALRVCTACLYGKSNSRLGEKNPARAPNWVVEEEEEENEEEEVTARIQGQVAQKRRIQKKRCS